MDSFTSSSEIERFARPVPRLRWRRAAALSLILLVAAVASWEGAMRRLGLHAGDLGDGEADWAAERRKVDAGRRDPIVIVGDSRILFDTDLDVWEKLSGHRPIQLALAGTNARPFLTDLANDEHFAGLVVMGITERSFFRDAAGRKGHALEYVASESPSQWAGHTLGLLLARAFAFLDESYALFPLIDQAEWPERDGVEGTYLDVWKISETFADRQTALWPRLLVDPYLREHARRVWMSLKAAVVQPEMIDKVISAAQRDVEKIRARGGEVVWIRPPSAGPLLAREETLAPRDRVWNALIARTRCFGLHFDDYPELRSLEVPEWSHLSRESATRFTRVYVRVLLANVRWLMRA